MIQADGLGMGHDWIIDVLADMRSFARQNDMPLLCAQLDEAMQIATAEISDIRARPVPRQFDQIQQPSRRRLD